MVSPEDTRPEDLAARRRDWARSGVALHLLRQPAGSRRRIRGYSLPSLRRDVDPAARILDRRIQGSLPRALVRLVARRFPADGQRSLMVKSPPRLFCPEERRNSLKSSRDDNCEIRASSCEPRATTCESLAAWRRSAGLRNLPLPIHVDANRENSAAGDVDLCRARMFAT